MRDSTGRGKFRAVHSQGQLARRIKEDGYLAIKQKVGRPRKWMKGETAVVRDIEAVAAVREAVGSHFNLTVDANNGYREHRRLHTSDC